MTAWTAWSSHRRRWKCLITTSLITPTSSTQATTIVRGSCTGTCGRAVDRGAAATAGTTTPAGGGHLL